jgi:cell division septum initiation protein DivIVA
MANFSIVKKGYETSQVDTYVEKVIKFTESKLSEQKKRIEELKEENRALQLKLNEYKEKEKTVGDAILAASEKAEEILGASRIRYALESERLKLFRDKWTKYVESASEKVRKIDDTVNMNAYLTRLDDELKEAIGGDLNIKKARIPSDPEKQFMSERERLSAADKGEMPKKIKVGKEANADSSEFKSKLKKALESNIKEDIVNPEDNIDEDDEDELVADKDIESEVASDRFLEREAEDECYADCGFADLLESLKL